MSHHVIEPGFELILIYLCQFVYPASTRLRGASIYDVRTEGGGQEIPQSCLHICGQICGFCGKKGREVEKSQNVVDVMEAPLFNVLFKVNFGRRLTDYSSLFRSLSQTMCDLPNHHRRLARLLLPSTYHLSSFHYANGTPSRGIIDGNNSPSLRPQVDRDLFHAFMDSSNGVTLRARFTHPKRSEGVILFVPSSRASGWRISQQVLRFLEESRSSIHPSIDLPFNRGKGFLAPSAFFLPLATIPHSHRVSGGIDVG